MNRKINVNDLDDYQTLALRTAPIDRAIYVSEDGKKIENAFEQTIWSLGLSGEAGEFADTINKIYGHGKPFTEDVRMSLAKEL